MSRTLSRIGSSNGIVHMKLMDPVENAIDDTREDFTAKLQFCLGVIDLASERRKDATGLAKNDTQVIKYKNGDIAIVEANKSAANKDKFVKDNLNSSITFYKRQWKKLYHEMIAKIFKLYFDGEQKKLIEALYAALKSAKNEDDMIRIYSEFYDQQIKKIELIVQKIWEKYEAQIVLLSLQIHSVQEELRQLHSERKGYLIDLTNTVKDFKIDGVKVFEDLKPNEMKEFLKEYTKGSIVIERDLRDQHRKRCPNLYTELDSLVAQRDTKEAKLRASHKPGAMFSQFQNGNVATNNEIKDLNAKIKVEEKKIEDSIAPAKEIAQKNLIKRLAKNHKNHKVQLLAKEENAAKFIQAVAPKMEKVLAVTKQIQVAEKKVEKFQNDLSGVIVKAQNEVDASIQKLNEHAIVKPKQEDVAKVVQEGAVVAMEKAQVMIEDQVVKEEKKEVAEKKEEEVETAVIALDDVKKELEIVNAQGQSTNFDDNDMDDLYASMSDDELNDDLANEVFHGIESTTPESTVHYKPH